MSDQINRTILDNFDVNHIPTSNHDIHKTSSHLTKSIENTSVQFVVSNRTEEFIDHSLLNPDYISTDISGNNFIIGLMANQEGGNITTTEHYHTGNFIGESISSNDIHFSNGSNYDLEHERRLTATILQLVKNGNLRIDGDTTQLIITNNRELIGINEPEKNNPNIEDSAHFLTIEDAQNLTHINEGQLKIYQSSQIPQLVTSLPQLTPIRRLSHSKNIINLNTNSTVVHDETINEIQNLKVPEIDQNRYQLQVEQHEELQQIPQPKPLIAKKVLPHKKRYGLTKKLKNSMDINVPTCPQTPLPLENESVTEHNQIAQQLYQEEPTVVNGNENIHLNALQFSCQLCGAGFHYQLDFFSHLKTHYEPFKEENTRGRSIIPSILQTSPTKKDLVETIVEKKIEPIYTTASTIQTVNDLNEINFENFSNISTIPVIGSTVANIQNVDDHPPYSQHKPKKYNKINNPSKSPTDSAINYASKFQNISNSNNVLTIYDGKTNQHISGGINETVQNSRNPISQNLLNLSSEFETSTTILPQLTPSKHLILPTPDEIEFSDPEDMLEGIRGVVDKVQESDSEDLESHSPKMNWYTNNVHHGPSMPRLRSLSNGPVVDQFQLFFKNDDENLKSHANNSENVLHLSNSDNHHSETIITITEILSSQKENFQTMIQPEHYEPTTSNYAHSIKSEKSNSSDNESMQSNEAKKLLLHDNINVPRKENETNTLISNNLQPRIIINIDDAIEKHVKAKAKKTKSVSVITDNVSATKTVAPIQLNSDIEIAIDKTNLSKSTFILNDTPPGEVIKKRRGRPPKAKINSNSKQSLVLPTDSDLKSNKVIQKHSVLNPSKDIQLSNMLESEIYSEPVEENVPNNINEIISDSVFDDNGNSDFNPEDESEDESEEINAREKKPKKKYICEKCHKIFNSINALKYHDFSHTGLRPHKCEECGKAFFALNALKTHQRVHTGDKPFKCEECGRAFRQWGDLTYHKISLHSNKKDYQCEFCGKSFARKYSLVIHRRIHTGERNYSCEFCSKSFRASSYLQNHRKIHTGEKPYNCETCGKNFRVCGDLKRHTKIHEREQKLNKHLDSIIKTEYEITEPDKITTITKINKR